MGDTRERDERDGVDVERRRLLVAVVIACAAAAGGAARANAAAIAAATPTPVAAPTADDWRSVLESMFPHERVERALYGVPAGALVAAAEKDPGARALLETGWRTLNDAAGGAWGAASPERRTSALATIVGTPLFVTLRQTAVFTFYNHPGVWAAFGYEGDAWRFGGWLGRGVNTLDWLPDPPAERN